MLVAVDGGQGVMVVSNLFSLCILKFSDVKQKIKIKIWFRLFMDVLSTSSGCG